MPWRSDDPAKPVHPQNAVVSFLLGLGAAEAAALAEVLLDEGLLDAHPIIRDFLSKLLSRFSQI